MARAQSEKVGRGACPACGASVIYRRSSGGLLSHKCEECESSGYAEPGGPAFKKNMATIAVPAAPAPETPPAKADEPPTTEKRGNFAFNL